MKPLSIVCVDHASLAAVVRHRYGAPATAASLCGARTFRAAIRLQVANLIVALLITIGCALLAGGCADPLEKRSTDEVGGQLQRGVTGQGTIGPIDREEGDPAGEHGVPQTHP